MPIVILLWGLHALTLVLFFFFGCTTGMWDLSSTTKNRTPVLCIGKWFLTTGPLGKCSSGIFQWILYNADEQTFSKHKASLHWLPSFLSRENCIFDMNCGLLNDLTPESHFNFRKNPFLPVFHMPENWPLVFQQFLLFFVSLALHVLFSHLGHFPPPTFPLLTPLVSQIPNNPSPSMWETWVGKITWRRAWKPTPVFLAGESL